MSGSGSNVVRIIENQLGRQDAVYQVVLVFSDVEDRSKSNTHSIASTYGIPLETNDIRGFYSDQGRDSVTDLELRPTFDRRTRRMIEPYDIDVIALGGYMSIVTEPLLDRYSGRIINVHPADLSVTEGQRRKYVGLHSVRDAILAGETEISSSTHVVRERVDYGEILMISKSIDVVLPTRFTVQELRKPKNSSTLDRVVKRNQNRLKKHGDWVIYPKTLEYIADGRFALDGAGNVYLEDRLLPNGVRL